MSNGKDDVIRGYARALFDVAQAEDALDRVSDELFRFAKRLDTEHELRSALTDIGLPADRKESILQDLLGERFSPHTLNTLKFVVSQGHSRELTAIVEQLAKMAAETQNREVAEVRSAVPLDEDQTRRLMEALSKVTGKTVEVKVIVDPSVVGGILAKVGDQVIDGTVRRRLVDLKEGLEGSHV